MLAYGTYAVPALPVMCMVGWALLWALDPASREHDMVETVRAATHEALMSQIVEAAKSVDITEAVTQAAGEAARALVGETLGRAPRRVALPPAHHEVIAPSTAPGGEAEDAPVEAMLDTEPSRKPSRNGRTAKAADIDPKASA